VLVLLVLIKVRFLSPPYSNCPGSTCLTHVGTEGTGCVVKTNFVAVPVTLKEVLVAAVRAPLVAFNVSPFPLALIWQPANVATPEAAVTGLVVQVSVPLPVPIASVTAVE
jgi:hypothetical protein